MKRHFTVHAKSSEQRILSSSESDERSWERFVRNHEDDSDEEFSYSAEQKAYDVLDELGVELEPSVQGGGGGIWIYDSDGNCLADNISYQGYCSKVSNLAYNAPSLSAFKRSYKSYIQRLISQ